MNLTFQIVAIISPFVAVLLTYFLSIKKARKDIDFDKEKVLNSVLSDLLNTRFTVTRVKLINDLYSNKKIETIFPKESLLQFAMSSGLIEMKSFKELEDSILKLKEYDALIYYRIEGIGANFEQIHEKFVSPLMKVLYEEEIKSTEGGVYLLIKDTLESLEDNILKISTILNKRTEKEVLSILDKKNNESDLEDYIKQIEQAYFEWMAPLLKPEESMTFDEFKEFSKSESFGEMVKLQLAVAKLGDLEGFINCIKNNPNASMSEITNMMESKSE